MGEIVNINGTLYAPGEATISVFDHGFLYGDSIYETLRTYSRKIFLKEKHLGRAYSSAEGISLEIPYVMPELEREIEKTLEKASNEDSLIRIVVTRGVGPIDIDPATAGRPNLIIYVKKFPEYPIEWYEKGVPISLVKVKRNPLESLPPRIKSGNFLNNIFAIQETREEGAHEGVMLNISGYVTEGTTSNVFIVKGGVLETPPPQAGILPGITRNFVLDLAAAIGIEAVETDIEPEELFGADECFLTSTTREILPVSRCGGKPIGEGRPGPVTMALSSEFRKRIEIFVNEG